MFIRCVTFRRREVDVRYDSKHTKLSVGGCSKSDMPLGSSNFNAGHIDRLQQRSTACSTDRDRSRRHANDICASHR